MTAAGLARLYIAASALALAAMAARMGGFGISAAVPLGLLVFTLFVIGIGLLTLVCLFGIVTIIAVRLYAALRKRR